MFGRFRDALVYLGDFLTCPSARRVWTPTYSGHGGQIPGTLRSESGRSLELHVVDPYNTGANSLLGATKTISLSITLETLRTSWGFNGSMCWSLLAAVLSALARACRRQPVRRQAADLLESNGYCEVDPFTLAMRPRRTIIGRSLLFFKLA